MSRHECWQVAESLGLDEASFDSALDFLHSVSLMFYFRDVLPEVVFVDPQVVLDKVSEVIEFMFELREPADQDEPSPDTSSDSDMGKQCSKPSENHRMLQHQLPRNQFPRRYLPPRHQVPIFCLLVGNSSTSSAKSQSSSLKTSDSVATTMLGSSPLMM